MNENQKIFYFDQNLCTGCDTCLVACKDWNDLKAGKVAYRKRVSVELGSFPDVKIYEVVSACNHCEVPACIDICPMGAITKRDKDGAVVVNRDICAACKACKGACPYSAPQFEDAEGSKMQKCSMCWDRLDSDAPAVADATSKLPACVAGCPQRALKFGTMAELQAQGVTDFSENANGFKHDIGTKPCIRFHRKDVNPKAGSAF